MLSFHEMNLAFCKENRFFEEKTSCLLEIFHYLLTQLLRDRLSEEKSFANFKELLLRHSVQRPPHSLAIFNLDDVKKIQTFALNTFYRHYDMYLYALTVKDMLILKTEPMFTHVDQKPCELKQG